MRPKLKGRQHFDEKFVKVKGKNCYDLNCIDSVTKYITAHLFVEERTIVKCKAFLRQIKATCYDQILACYHAQKHKPKEKRKLITFVSDGFANYKTAFSILFGKVAKLTHGVPIKAKKNGLEHNNNPIERYNGKIDDRTKIMRGGFGSFAGGEKFMNMNRTITNFVNPHQTLHGKTPAEVAEIDLRLGRNKLLSLIRYWSKCRR